MLGIESSVGSSPAPVSAADVFRVVARGASTIDGHQLSRPPEESCPDVIFMTRPLTVALRVRHADRVSLEVQPVALDRSESVTLPGQLQDDHVIDRGRWHPLESESLEAARDWLRSHPGTRLPARDYARLYEGLPTGLVIDDQVELDRLRQDLAPETQPAGLQAELYPYQRVGYRWLVASAEAGLGCILADEMGLGKTLQVIAAVEELRTAGRGPFLVVAPVTLLVNWLREFQRFAPEVSIYIHRGPDRARYPGALKGIDVVLTNYDTVINDLGLMVSIDWEFIALDEAQAIKNPDTKRARTLAQIPRRAAFALTGTPVENKALDLWSLADFVVPGYLGTRGHFEASLRDDPERLAVAARPILLRREVADVADSLPPVVDVDVVLEMFDPEASTYDELLAQVGASVETTPPLTLITRLRQFTGHPSLLGLAAQADPVASSAKLARLLEIVEDIARRGEKVLIFSAFTRLSDLIAEVIRLRLHISAQVMDGRTPPTDRQTVVDSFGDREGPAVLILHPTTGGSGLNITAANHVIHYSLEWNPAKESQATARAHRTGQVKTVFVYRFIYERTIDEVIDAKLKAKQALADVLIAPTDSLGLEDVLSAVRLRPRRLGANSGRQ